MMLQLYVTNWATLQLYKITVRLKKEVVQGVDLTQLTLLLSGWTMSDAGELKQTSLSAEVQICGHKIAEAIVLLELSAQVSL